MIIRTVYEIIEHLFNTYGEVILKIFQECKAAVKALDYNPNTPVDNLFKEIGNLVGLSGQDNVVMTKV